MAPSHFGTYERVPEWACCKLQEDEELTVRDAEIQNFLQLVNLYCRLCQLSRLSLQRLYMPCSTVLISGVARYYYYYYTSHGGNANFIQSVLIHSAAGGVGLAAIQIAQLVGAKVGT
jgi:hypothetical protein